MAMASGQLFKTLPSIPYPTRHSHNCSPASDHWFLTRSALHSPLLLPIHAGDLLYFFWPLVSWMSPFLGIWWDYCFLEFSFLRNITLLFSTFHFHGLAWRFLVTVSLPTHTNDQGTLSYRRGCYGTLCSPATAHLPLCTEHWSLFICTHMCGTCMKQKTCLCAKKYFIALNLLFKNIFKCWL